MRIFLVGLICFFQGILVAQQFPYLNSEITGPQWHNPASFGTWNHRSVNLVGQFQWPELNEPIRSEVLTAEYLWWKPGWPVKMAFGTSFLTERVADFSTNLVMANANVHVRLGGSARLSVGVNPGFWMKKLHADILSINDSSVLFEAGNQFKPFLGGGVMLYWPNVFYLGAGFLPVYPMYFEKLSYTAVPHLFLNGAYRYRITREYALLFTGNAGFTTATHKFAGMIFLERIRTLIEFKFGAGYSSVGEIKAAAGIGFRNFWVNYFFSIQPTNPLPGPGIIHELKLSWQVPKFILCGTCERW